jgi:hypothetical protein
LVANSGANDILVYLGTGDGRFAPPQKFFAGTDPVAITVDDVTGNGLPDLIVTNSGSNDVSIFLSEGRGSNWNLVTGPRLNVGFDPVSTTLADVNGDGIPDILVVNQGSNTVELLPGLGGGFFNDRAPRVFAAGKSPVRAFVGHFDSAPGLGLVIVNSQSNDLTYYSNFMAPGAQAVTIPSGGLHPIAAIQTDFGADGYSDLVVANNGDGTIACFDGGPRGLFLANSVTLPGSTHPTDLVLAGGTTGQLRLFVTAKGQNNLISVSISFLATGSTTVTTASSTGSTILSVHNQTPGPAGNFETSSLELARGVSSDASSTASAPGASSSVSSTSATTIGAGTATVMQSLSSLSGGSISSFVSMLLQIDPTHVTEVQPLRSGAVASVAVMLTLQGFRVDRLDEQLRSEMETEQETGPQGRSLLDLRSQDQIETPQLRLERYLSGVENELRAATSAENLAPCDLEEPRGDDRDLRTNPVLNNEGDRPRGESAEPALNQLRATRLLLPSSEAAPLSDQVAAVPIFDFPPASVDDAVPNLDQGCAIVDPSQALLLTSSVAASVVVATRALRGPVGRKRRYSSPPIGISSVPESKQV